jgi:hypothetical protein
VISLSFCASVGQLLSALGREIDGHIHSEPKTYRVFLEFTYHSTGTLLLQRTKCTANTDCQLDEPAAFKIQNRFNSNETLVI